MTAPLQVRRDSSPVTSPAEAETVTPPWCLAQPWAARGLTGFLLAIALVALILDRQVVAGLSSAVSSLPTLGSTFGSLRWPYVAAVLVLGAAHYVAAAVASRAASGLTMPFGWTVLAQLAASAANRLTPLGAGGAGVTMRYLSRAGLPPAAALSATTALTVVGGVADLVTLALLVGVGSLMGLHGMSSGAHQLGSQAVGLLHPLSWPWVGGAACLIMLCAAGSTRLRRQLGRLRILTAPIAALVAQPRRLLTVAAASAATTLLLGFAFINSAYALGAVPTQPLGTLLVAFMVVGTASAAVPVPAGLGITEIGLTAALTGAGMPTASAISAVLLFRLITFWLPAVVGVPAARHLRHLGAL